jgi:hypothetical protein
MKKVLYDGPKKQWHSGRASTTDPETMGLNQATTHKQDKLQWKKDL